MVHYIALLGLGSNLGNREENLSCALSELRRRVGIVLQQSELYYSMPVGFESVNYFVNQVVAVATRLSPNELLYATQEIERVMGRTLKSQNGIHHDRIIDIDILKVLFSAEEDEVEEELSLCQPDLILPHPRIMERAFVYLPMSEIYTVE